MLSRVLHLVGGQAMRRGDLRLLFAAVFLSFLGTSVSFPLRQLYAQAHGASPAEIGLMAATFLLAPLLAQVPIGWLVDRWGRVPVFKLGLVSHTLFTLGYIPFNTPSDLIVLRFVEGISASTFAPAVNAYIADVVPEEHRSEAYGVLNATLSGGMLIGPLIGGVVGQAYGFITAFAVNVAIEALAVVLVWGRLHEPATHTEHKMEGGLFSWRSLISLPLAGGYIAFFAAQMVMGMLSALWAIWLHDLGGSYTYIGITFTVFALPQILFGALAGRLSDRLGRAPLLLVSGLLIAVTYSSYGFVTNLTLILVLGVVEGLFAAFQQPAIQALIAESAPPGARGRVQGVAGASGAVGGAIAAFASLPLYHNSRAVPFVLAGVIIILGACASSAGASALARRRRSVLQAEAASAIAR
jgi:MFS family permease